MLQQKLIIDVDKIIIMETLVMMICMMTMKFEWIYGREPGANFLPKLQSLCSAQSAPNDCD